uniref:Uncharacterized protein n=1 Tax=Pyxicephalus adspersus TaxID=30357 RepID=A0AAV3A665_PYXAD|nr:TPA: hypothetical protein GDO54_013172 [Pyxicephalus adspersus]
MFSCSRFHLHAGDEILGIRFFYLLYKHFFSAAQRHTRVLFVGNFTSPNHVRLKMFLDYKLCLHNVQAVLLICHCSGWRILSSVRMQHFKTVRGVGAVFSNVYC